MHHASPLADQLIQNKYKAQAERACERMHRFKLHKQLHSCSPAELARQRISLLLSWQQISRSCQTVWIAPAPLPYLNASYGCDKVSDGKRVCC